MTHIGIANFFGLIAKDYYYDKSGGYSIDVQIVTLFVIFQMLVNHSDLEFDMLQLGECCSQRSQ